VTEGAGAGVGERPGQAVGEEDWERHELGREIGALAVREIEQDLRRMIDWKLAETRDTDPNPNQPGARERMTRQQIQRSIRPVHKHDGDRWRGVFPDQSTALTRSMSACRRPTTGTAAGLIPPGHADAG